MSVFLRWGILGILGVAGLLYAYNASKRISEARAGRAPSASSAPTVPDPPAAEPAAEPISEACEQELQVAQLAMDMRRQAAPLDRLLRSQEIAWQEPAERRQRLEKVAVRWYAYPDPISAEGLRTAVVKDCGQPTPAP